MSPTKKFFSGNTLEQAVLQAARFFQVEPERVAYEPVERRHGFLKVRRRVVIGVDPENPARAAGAAPPAEQEAAAAGSAEVETARPPREPSANAPGEPEDAPSAARSEPRSRPQAAERQDREDPWKDLAAADATEAAEEGLRRLFRLGDLDLQATVSAGDAGLEVELRGPDEDQLFEDRGRLLLALQHLLPRMVRGLTGASVPCRVDSDNFHEVRAEQLRMLAQDAAAEVRREGRMQTLEPMSPDERRIVHLTLTEDPAVETESHGTGLFKRVAVRPVRSGRERGHHNR